MRLNRAQRIAVLVGWAAALWAIGSWALGTPRRMDGGWFNYAPANEVVYSAGTGAWFGQPVTALVVLGLVAAWVAVAAWLLHGLGRRIALLIGLAAALWTVGWYAVVDAEAPFRGWARYTSSSIAGPRDPTRFGPAVSTAIVLILVAVWVAAALRLLRDR